MTSANWYYTVEELLDCSDDNFDIPDTGVNSDIEGLDEEDFEENWRAKLWQSFQSEGISQWPEH